MEHVKLGAHQDSLLQPVLLNIYVNDTAKHFSGWTSLERDGDAHISFVILENLRNIISEAQTTPTKAKRMLLHE